MVATLQDLQNAFPKTIDEAVQLVEALEGCTQWFAGGTKELKATVPIWTSVESKLETLIEFVEVTQSMSVLAQQPPQATTEGIEANLRAIAAQLRERQQRWSSVLPQVRGRIKSNQRLHSPFFLRNCSAVHSGEDWGWRWTTECLMRRPRTCR